MGKSVIARDVEKKMEQDTGNINDYSPEVSIQRYSSIFYSHHYSENPKAMYVLG